MQIPKEILSEKNYEGNRFIEIEKDEILTPLFDELARLQKEADPYIEESAPLYKIVDPVFQKIGVIEGKKREAIEKFEGEKVEIRSTVQDTIDKLQDLEHKCEMISKKSDVIKNKLMPILFDKVKDKLGEFEIATEVKEKDGKVYVEVQDKLEELIKAIRLQKAKNAPKK
jgi:hypothetical protein